MPPQQPGRATSASECLTPATRSRLAQRRDASRDRTKRRERTRGGCERTEGGRECKSESESEKTDGRHRQTDTNGRGGRAAAAPTSSASHPAFATSSASPTAAACMTAASAPVKLLICVVVSSRDHPGQVTTWKWGPRECRNPDETPRAGWATQERRPLRRACMRHCDVRVRVRVQADEWRVSETNGACQT